MKKIIMILLILSVLTVPVLSGCGSSRSSYSSSGYNSNYNNNYPENEYQSDYSVPNPETETAVRRLSDADVLHVLSNCTYRMDIWSINVNKMVYSLIQSFQSTVYTLEEAERAGVVSRTTAVSKPDNVYIVSISGEVSINPEIPNYTKHEDGALVAVMNFDDNGQLLDYKIEVSQTLETAALILMSSGY